MAERQVGFVAHYFGNVGIAGVMLTEGELSVGDLIHIKGQVSDLTTRVQSIQLNHVAVERARRGDNVGIMVPGHVRDRDRVFKVVP